MLEGLKKNLQQETLAERKQRMIPAAVFGALIATVYVWTFILINVYTFPSLPLGVDWGRLISMWIQFAVALALFGAVAAWFTEEYVGIVGGAIIFTIALMIVSLFSSRTNNPSAFQAILTSLPLIGISMLGAWGLRWAAHRHLDIQHDEQPKRRRNRLTKHLLTIILVGLIPGILGRMDLTAENSLRQLHELLQAAPNDTSVWPRLPVKQVPSLQEHFGVDYKIYARQSRITAGALDVTIRFADGYAMACVLPVGSGNNFITQCNEGEDVKTNR